MFRCWKRRFLRHVIKQNENADFLKILIKKYAAGIRKRAGYSGNFWQVRQTLHDLQTVGILKHLVFVGSWCQNFYRILYNNPVEIPAARTLC
jgi:hypothetical protein